MIDSHIHLDQYDDIDRQIEIWMNAGISNVIAVSTDLASCYHTLKLKLRYPTFVQAAIGFHPEQALPNEKDFLEWQNLLKCERHLISAIGEVGLPYYSASKLEQSLKEYILFLKKMIDISIEQDLPIVLHAVHEHADIVFQLLVEHGATKVHFHWLKSSFQTLHRILDQGYYVSITPEVLYRERDQLFVKEISLDLLLLETDGPWPYNGPFEGKVTTPLFLLDIVQKLAEIKKININDIISITSANARKLYKI